jgi:hypothetical protein
MTGSELGNRPLRTKGEARDELATIPGVTPEWVEMRLAALPG